MNNQTLGQIAMQTNLKRVRKEPNHVLYSRGCLIDSPELDQENSLAMLASVTKHSVDQVRERLLSGKRKKIRSSASLKKLILLQEKLVSCGLDAYIKLGPSNR